MKTFLKRLALSVALAAFVVMPIAKASAQGADKPVLVVSLASVDEQMKDANFIVGAAGMPEAGMFIALAATDFIEHFDNSKPAGIAVFVNNPAMPDVVGFVGVSDLEAILDQYSDQIGPFENNNGIYEGTGPNGDPIFIKEKDGWALFSNNKASINLLPADPTEMLGELPDNYNVGIQANIQNVPGPLKQLAIQALKEGFEQAMTTLEQQDPAAAEFQRQMNEISMQSIIDVIEQTDKITLGLDIDPTEEAIQLDVDLTFLGTSKFAKQIASLEGIKSDFMGVFSDDDAITLHMVSQMTPEDIQMTSAMVAGMRTQVLAELGNDGAVSGEQLEVAKDVVGNIIDVLDATIKKGKINMGAAVDFDDNVLSMVAGGTVADGKKLEDSLQKLVSVAKAELPPEFKIEMNTDSYNGIGFHQLSAQVPGNEEEAKMVFGETLVVTVGIGDDAVFMAIGEDGISSIKSLVDNSKDGGESSEAMSSFIVRLAPILKFGSQFDETGMAGQFTEAVDADADEISVTGTLIENGTRSRLEIQTGILKLIGAAVKQMGGGLPGF